MKKLILILLVVLWSCDHTVYQHEYEVTFQNGDVKTHYKLSKDKHYTPVLDAGCTWFMSGQVCGIRKVQLITSKKQ